MTFLWKVVSVSAPVRKASSRKASVMAQSPSRYRMPSQASPVTPAQLRANSAMENTGPGGAFGDDRSLAGGGTIGQSDITKVCASGGRENAAWGASGSARRNE